MTKLTAKDGNVIALKDHTAVYDNIVYLSDIDSPERYEEIPKEEGEKIKKQLEAKYALHPESV